MRFEREGRSLSLEEFEGVTGAKWRPHLVFADTAILSALTKQGAKLHEKGEMTFEQVWLGRYFQKELLAGVGPDVSIRWIDSVLGWGVFAERPFKKMEFIAEYAGTVRKRIKADAKNSYCFEYVVTPDRKTSYVIDAREQGGVGRYLNHSASPNLLSGLATLDQISHVILYAKEPIAKGTQLCYDYGPDYWSKRTAPISL